MQNARQVFEDSIQKHHAEIQLKSTTNHKYLTIKQLSQKVTAQGKALVFTKKM